MAACSASEVESADIEATLAVRPPSFVGGSWRLGSRAPRYCRSASRMHLQKSVQIVHSCMTVQTQECGGSKAKLTAVLSADDLAGTAVSPGLGHGGR